MKCVKSGLVLLRQQLQQTADVYAWEKLGSWLRDRVAEHTHAHLWSTRTEIKFGSQLAAVTKASEISLKHRGDFFLQFCSGGLKLEVLVQELCPSSMCTDSGWVLGYVIPSQWIISKNKPPVTDFLAIFGGVEKSCWHVIMFSGDILSKQLLINTYSKHSATPLHCRLRGVSRCLCKS